MKNKKPKKVTKKKKIITTAKKLEYMSDQIKLMGNCWQNVNAVLTRHETQHKDIVYLLNAFGEKQLEAQKMVFEVLLKMTNQLFFLEKQNNIQLSILKDISLSLLKQQGIVDEVEEKENPKILLDESTEGNP